MIVIRNLTKTYLSKIRGRDKIIALENINLRISKGDVFGLIGPNGAGKTTLLKIISTLLLPDKGTVLVDGHDVVKEEKIVREKVGLLSAEFARSLYWRLTGRQNLKFFAKLKNLHNQKKRIDELIELFNLKRWENEYVMKYSTGMKHKLAFAIALLSDPPILLLDEPLVGIDPVASSEIKSLINRELKDKTIIWASNNLYEVERMCNKVALIDKGKIILEGETEKLKDEHWGYTKITVISDKPHLFGSLEGVDVKEGKVEIKTYDLRKTYVEIMKVIEENDVEVKEIITSKPSLEDIFMEMIKNA